MWARKRSPMSVMFTSTTSLINLPCKTKKQKQPRQNEKIQRRDDYEDQKSYCCFAGVGRNGCGGAKPSDGRETHGHQAEYGQEQATGRAVHLYANRDYQYQG